MAKVSDNKAIKALGRMGLAQEHILLYFAYQTPAVQKEIELRVNKIDEALAETSSRSWDAEEFFNYPQMFEDGLIQLPRPWKWVRDIYDRPGVALKTTASNVNYKYEPPGQELLENQFYETNQIIEGRLKTKFYDENPAEAHYDSMRALTLLSGRPDIPWKPASSHPKYSSVVASKTLGKLEARGLITREDSTRGDGKKRLTWRVRMTTLGVAAATALYFKRGYGDVVGPMLFLGLGEGMLDLRMRSVDFERWLDVLLEWLHVMSTIDHWVTQKRGFE